MQPAFRRKELTESEDGRGSELWIEVGGKGNGGWDQECRWKVNMISRNSVYFIIFSFNYSQEGSS